LYYVYILYSPSADRYYIGQTENLDHRLQAHSRGSVTSTKAYAPWQLKYCEIYPTRADAMRREREIKSRKSRQFIEALIAQAQLAESRERD
jgi:putative endonuclease